MKKAIRKLMLIISLLFLVGTIYFLAYAIGNSAFFDEPQQIMLILCLAFFGLFLGLYRMIDLLEKK